MGSENIYHIQPFSMCCIDWGTRLSRKRNHRRLWPKKTVRIKHCNGDVFLISCWGNIWFEGILISTCLSWNPSDMYGSLKKTFIDIHTHSVSIILDWYSPFFLLYFFEPPKLHNQYLLSTLYCCHHFRYEDHHKKENKKAHEEEKPIILSSYELPAKQIMISKTGIVLLIRLFWTCSVM